MSNADTPAADWYPDPFGRHEHRYWDGTAWTANVSSHGKQSTDEPVGEAKTVQGAQSVAKIAKQLDKAGVAGGAVSGAALLDQLVLVVNQKAKLLEVNSEYAIFDGDGTQIGMIRQVGQSKLKKAIRVLTSYDQYMTHKFQIVDAAGNIVLAVTRPAKFMKSKVIINDGAGASVGEIVQENMFGKIRFGMFAGGVAMDALIGGRKTRFDPLKFNWLGSMTESSSACYAWHTTGFKTLKDVMKKGGKRMILGASSGGSSTAAWPKTMNAFIGTNFKVITGYKGSKGIILAMERGEVQGLCGYFISSIRNVRPTWLKEGKVVMLVQEAKKRHADFPNIPTVFEYAKNKATKQAFNLVFGWQVMGRPFTLPPGVAPDRVAAMRKAFWDTMQDKKFLKDGKKSRLTIKPRTYKQVNAYLKEAWASPKKVVKSVFYALDRDKKKHKRKKKK